MTGDIPFAHASQPDLPLAAVRREVERELAERLRLYPQRIGAGRMTPEDADRGTAIARAWLEDCERIHHVRQGTPRARQHNVAWAVRRQALVRELELRARSYPRMVADGRLHQADADARTNALTALRRIYEDGFDWTASNGARPAFYGGEPSTIARGEWLQLQLAFALDRGDANWERIVRDLLHHAGLTPAAVGGQQEMAL